ncbi:MAG: hypothetical protein ACRD3B_13505 [Candidatus Sulfotelmatobacter sp.]
MPSSQRSSLSRLARRILSRLADALDQEPDPWLRDDLKIAKLTVLYAASGEAVECSPDVLASYEVLGVYPEKVWPKILARRKALGFEEISGAAPVPKKPPQSVKLWFEKTNAARATNSRGAMQVGLRDQAITLPMATRPLAALYPNPDEPSRAKKAPYSLDEMKVIVGRAYVKDWVKLLTLGALEARGAWPNQPGPASTMLSVALVGIQLESGNAPRRTTQHRIKRACELGYWRKLRGDNTWINCPQCGAERRVGKCEKCPYRGRMKGEDGKYTGEFSRPAVYEFDIEKFRHEPPRCRTLNFRSYEDYKAARNKVTEMPRKTEPEQIPPPKPPAPAAPQPQRKTAEHQRTERISQPKLSKTECAKFVADMVTLIQRSAVQTISVQPDPACATCHGHGVYPSAAHPGESLGCHCSERSAKLTWREALRKTAQTWSREPEAIVEALKFHGYAMEPDVGG